MAKARVSSTELIWIFREELVSRDVRFRGAPSAIVPADRSWQAVAPPRYRETDFARQIKRVQEKLKARYVLAVD